MLIPTVASALLFWRKLERVRHPRRRKGVNKEFGHSEMIGLDRSTTASRSWTTRPWCTAPEQPGPQRRADPRRTGKYDIDHGPGERAEHRHGRPHPGGRLQPLEGPRHADRPYDNAAQAGRVVRSILSWEACAQAARSWTPRRSWRTSRPARRQGRGPDARRARQRPAALRPDVQGIDPSPDLHGLARSMRKPSGHVSRRGFPFRMPAWDIPAEAARMAR